MKPITVLLVAAAVAALVGTFVLTGIAQMPPIYLLLDMGMIGKMLMFLVIPLIIAVVVIGLVAAGKRSGRSPVASLLGWLALGFGAVGALYTTMIIVRGAQISGGSPSLAIMAPSIAEATLQLGLGLLAAALAAVLNDIAAKRAAG